MNKMILFMMVSLDGYVEGLDHDLSWHNAGNKEFSKFAIDQLNEAGSLVFGRKTYELMASFWPSKAGREGDHAVAKRMNDMPKIVISDSLDKADWNNTRLIKENVASQLKQLKSESAHDLLVLGSNELCVSLLEMELLDELRLMINPVVLGAGTPLLQGVKQPQKLLLVKDHRFDSDNVLLTYYPA
jgi:dihydrofolate reductase